MKSYKDLVIYRIAFRLALEVHQLTMPLPKTEQFELGSQVRRSAQSVRANIIEGYGRNEYKSDFVRFLLVANASLLETESHLDMLNQIYHRKEIGELLERYSELGKRLFRFVEYVEKNWKINRYSENG